MPAPVFFMPARRTSVRYKGTRGDLCSYCVANQMRPFCAHSACYLIPRWRRSRTPREPHAGQGQHGNSQIELTKTARSSSRHTSRPSSRSRHAPPHDTASPNRPSPRQAIPPASRQPRIVPPQRHPTRTTKRTRTEQQQRREKTRRTETSEASEGTRADKNGAHDKRPDISPRQTTSQPPRPKHRRTNRLYDTPKRTNETKGRSERRGEGRNGQNGSRGETKGRPKTIHNTDTKKPQEKHTTTSYSAHDTKKMKNGKKQVAGQQAEPIEISIHEYVEYMDMGEYGNMGKIWGYGKDTKKSYRFIYLII